MATASRAACGSRVTSRFTIIASIAASGVAIKTDGRQHQLVTYNICMDLTLPELEQAINYWRALRPSTGEERALSPEVNALATVYAMMIFQRSKTVPLASLSTAAQQLLDSWRRQAV